MVFIKRHEREREEAWHDYIMSSLLAVLGAPRAISCALRSVFGEQVV